MTDDQTVGRSTGGGQHARLLAAAFAAATLVLPAVVRAQQSADGFKADLLADLNEAAEKTVSLAEAMPAAKYAWRPGEGVRSVGEVYMHVAGANYMLAGMAGVKPPADAPGEMAKGEAKDMVVEELEKSFAFLRKAIEDTSGAAWDRQVKVFGHERSIRAVYLLAVTHVHEHLGQSIAYARMNGVVPPWSRPKK